MAIRGGTSRKPFSRIGSGTLEVLSADITAFLLFELFSYHRQRALVVLVI